MRKTRELTSSIAEARRIAGVDQALLARVVGVAPQRLSELERGHRPLPAGFEPRVLAGLMRILLDRLAAIDA